MSEGVIDGRDYIEECYAKMKELSEHLNATQAGTTLAQTASSALDWTKKCRKKVWLRTKEGMDLAKGVLDALHAIPEDGADISDVLETYLNRVRDLAKVLSYRVAIIT